MPTVTETADLVCQTTGLSTTSTERAIVIAAMNYVYRRSVREAGARRLALTAAALTAGTSDYTIGTSPFTDTDIAQIRYLTCSGNGQTIKLTEKSEAEILTLRESAASGEVCFYAIVYPTIMFWPPPAGTETINGSYHAYPKTLVESGPAAGQESTPTAYPAEFHDSVLYHGACARAYDYRQNALAAYHWEQYKNGLEELRAFVNEVGGLDGASVIDSYAGRHDWGTY